MRTSFSRDESPHGARATEVSSMQAAICLTFAAALKIAEAAGARFRLVVVSGTTMNATYYNQLRKAGFC